MGMRCVVFLRKEVRTAASVLAHFGTVGCPADRRHLASSREAASAGFGNVTSSSFTKMEGV